MAISYGSTWVPQSSQHTPVDNILVTVPRTCANSKKADTKPSWHPSYSSFKWTDQQYSCPPGLVYFWYSIYLSLYAPSSIYTFMCHFFFMSYLFYELHLFILSFPQWLSNPQGQELLFLLEIYQEKANTQNSCSFEASI